MKLSIGIVGLPNVGKSTLFNALTLNKVPAENYPFCTIDPNVGIVEVQDKRIKAISEIVRPAETKKAVIEFVDIAGLVSGAHKGEGLGNKFLSNIREVDAILHVIRDFENKNIQHINHKIDPESDKDIINTELILKDLETVSKRKAKIDKEYRTHKNYKEIMEVINLLEKHLSEGKLAVDFKKRRDDEEISMILKTFHLLTDKKVIYLVNTADQSSFLDSFKKKLSLPNDTTIMRMDVKTEYDIFMLEEPDRSVFLDELGIQEPGLYILTRLAYETLGLISFFTAGEEEVRAWTIEKGTDANNAAGVIHQDFADNFIAAEVVSYDDFVKVGGWEEAKKQGKVRLEGRNYIVKDGDVIIFKHSRG